MFGRRAKTSRRQCPKCGQVTTLHYLSGLPLEMDLPQTLFPPAVIALIIANIVVLILAYTHGFADWVGSFGMVPAEVLRSRRLHTLLTHMFMHRGVLHLIGNMYFLYISGDNLEEPFGWHRFLGLFLVCGIVGALAHAVGTGAPRVPAVGAQGNQCIGSADNGQNAPPRQQCQKRGPRGHYRKPPRQQRHPCPVDRLEGAGIKIASYDGIQHDGRACQCEQHREPPGEWPASLLP